MNITNEEKGYLWSAGFILTGTIIAMLFSYVALLISGFGFGILWFTMEVND